MPESLLATKLFLPSPRSDAIYRDQLIVRLNAGLARKLTLVSAPAGFGKTTLLSTWLSGCDRPVAWLSLDEADSDLSRFLAYLVAALQTCAPQLGGEMPALLASQQPPPAETLLTNLLNAIAAIPHDLILVLDDYHTIAAAPVDQALTFLLDRLPPHLHLVIATREDPNIPLARYRARHELSELRAADLRFTPTEATEYLNRVMGLDLADDAIAVLDARTEGWITGLHLAALSLQGQPDSAEFIAAFTGSHQFVLDYLVEEVLQRQPEPMQHFLLRTAILDRMCGSLCDAVLDEPAGSGQTILEAIEHANLFIVPLDRERHWYRYHHLFRDLLRKRLGQRHPPEPVAEYQIRASRWFEEHGLPAEAFHYAAAADDVARAERLIEHKEMPLHVRGNVNAILDWLWALPTTVLDARPSLWVKSATLALVAGRTNGVAARLQAAEQALPPGEPDEPTRNLIGIIAAARATLAVTQYQAETTMEPPPLPPDVCPTCRGAGYMVADAPYGHPRFAKLIRCACTQTEQQQRRQGRLEQLSNLAEVRSLTFEAFNPDVPGVRKAYLRAREFAQQPQGWLLLFGSYGAGKTHLAAAAAHAVLARGTQVLFTVVPDLLDHLRATYGPTSEVGYDEHFELVRTVPLLVLDDLGTESATAWAREKLYQIVNHRSNLALPTIITSNRALEHLDQRIVSRMHQHAFAGEILRIAAADYRTQMHQRRHP